MVDILIKQTMCLLTLSLKTGSLVKQVIEEDLIGKGH